MSYNAFQIARWQLQRFQFACTRGHVQLLPRDRTGFFDTFFSRGRVKLSWSSWTAALLAWGSSGSSARFARRVAAPSSANDVLEVTAANKNQTLSLSGPCDLWPINQRTALLTRTIQTDGSAFQTVSLSLIWAQSARVNILAICISSGLCIPLLILFSFAL